MGDPKFPYVLTTYRLTEHYLAGGMSRWLPWLTELRTLRRDQSRAGPRERHQESRLVQDLQPAHADSRQGSGHAAAAPFTIDGKVIHQVGMPWHWGYEGLSTGDIVNELTSLVADPNVSMHEGKAFVCSGESLSRTRTEFSTQSSALITQDEEIEVQHG